MRGLIAFIAAMILIVPCAKAATLKLELAQDRVDITTGFNGTQVVLFGTTNIKNADIVVVLKGPEKKVIVRHKSRVGGAWMNTSSMEFRRVPSYYDFATTKSEEELAPPELLKENHIGLQNLDFYPEDASQDTQVVDYFSDALIRSLQQKGFYPLKPTTVTFVDPQFFKIIFNLPPGVPTGIYSIEGTLIENQKQVARETQSFQVGQVGFNAKIYNFATGQSLLYGIFSILIALFSGWAAFTFLRRD